MGPVAAMIRVLLADDSAVTREYLTFALGQVDGIAVVGAARDGLEAIEECRRLKPDVVLMDVHMPRMDGYEAARRIMEETPAPIVMMTSSLSRGEVEMGFEAVRAGALTLVSKPQGLDHPDEAESVRALATTLRLMAEVKVIRRWPRRAGPAASPQPRPIRGRGVQLVAVGASTGGPAAVVEILAELPATLRVPILVVQHIAKGFVSDLVQWWAGQTALGVKLAQEGDLMHPATVYVAPDDWQLGITPTRRIRLTRDAAQDGFRPSACHLFESVAAVYGASAMGVLLTGMGGDGAAGLKRLRDAGGVTVAQDQETSVVFGMPGEAIRLGAAEYVLSPGEIAALIKSAASRP